MTHKGLSWLLILSTILFPARAASIVDSLSADASADYVIVGGGLGGLVLANRLSASGSSVIVIEAGPSPEHEDIINDPYQYLALTVAGSYNWQWPTVNQSIGGNRQIISGGKALGGSTSINGMAWTRAQSTQYDAIATLNSDPSWSFKSLLRYMKKAETFNKPSALQKSQGASFIPSAHGYEGPVGSGYLIPYNGWAYYQAFTKTAKDFFGYGGGDLASGNANIGAQNAFSVHPSPDNSKTLRSSSAVSYLYPLTSVHSKAPLEVLPNHLATKILWSPKPKGPAQAIGVEYAANTSAPRSAVHANKEVIICAGAIMTPAFLQLSGVGDRKRLSALGIKTIVDLPAVGTNLQDQALNIVAYTPTPEALASPAYMGGQQLGEGSVNLPSLAQLVGKATARKMIKDLKNTVRTRAQAIVKRGGSVSVKGLERVFKSQINVIEQGAPIAEISAMPLQTLLTGVVWGLLPQTQPFLPRGTVRSCGPSGDSQIDPCALCDSSFGKFDSGGGVAVGLGRPLNGTDAQWQAWITSQYSSVFHPVGTVAMLPEADGGGVDTKLRLYGTQNVRVVDASVIPVQLSAHLSSTLYGIAEKAADLILQDA